MHQTFVLTPYRVVVAHFLSKYLDFKIDNRIEERQIHLQKSFQVIVSLDLTFDELMDILHKPIILNRNCEETGILPIVETLEQDFLQEFQRSLGVITTADSLSTFVDRIDFGRDALDKEMAETMRKQCHQKSIIGMYFRKVVIHFKRLSFNEVTMLVRNVYEYCRPYMKDCSSFIKKDDEDEFKFPAALNKTSSIFQENKDDVTLEKLEAYERKLHNDYKNLSVHDRKRKIELENKMIIISELINERKQTLAAEAAAAASAAASANLSEATSTNQQEQETGSEMLISKDNSIMDEDSTINEDQRSSQYQHQQRQQQPQDPKPGRDYNGFDDDLKNVHTDAHITQQYLVNQVNLILTNEKRSLPPEDILKLVDHFYKKHNAFQYQQAIHYNYRMNVRLGVKGSHLDSASSLTNSDNGHGNDIANIFSKRFGDLQSSNNFHNDLYYLKFINALRMNDYPSAQECLHKYFDNKDFTFAPPASNDPFAKMNLAKKKNGETNGVSLQGTNNCWALLNIGIMHAHFRHFDLAYDALDNCVQIARDSKDNKCLQYQMVWMLYVLEQLEKPQSVSTNVDSSKTRFWKLFNSVFEDVNHLKSSKVITDEYFVTANLMKLISLNERKLPYIAAMAYLHLEKQLYMQPIRALERRQPLSILLSVEKQLSSSYLRPPISQKPLLLASRYMMDDVLQKQYSMHAAFLNAYGAHHLADITSKLLARMDFAGVLQEKNYAHVNENHAIAFRNIAFYAWKIGGNSESALECLSFFQHYISQYDKNMNTIIASAKIEIEFEACLLSGDWPQATRCAEIMRVYNQYYSGIMFAKLKYLRGNKMEALKCLERVIGDEELSRIPQNVEHNEMLLKCFKKSKTTIKVSEPMSAKNRKLKFNLSASLNRSNNRFSNSKKKMNISLNNQKGNDCSETIIIENAATQLSVLSPEIDPYLWLYVKLLKAQMDGNPFELLEIVQLAQNYAFKQIEIKAELEIVGIQQRKFGQYYEAQERLDDLIIKVLSSGIQEDIAKAYYLSAVNHYFIHTLLNSDDVEDKAEAVKKYVADYDRLPLRMRLNNDINENNYHIHIARWNAMRSTAIYYRLQYKSSILDSAFLGRLIEREIFGDVHYQKYGDVVSFGTRNNSYEKRFVFYTKLANIYGPVVHQERL